MNRLAPGAEYVGQLGQIAYDETEDKVQCHLCGCWFRAFGGPHLGVSTRQEVRWRCPDCGQQWRARVRARAAGSGCPRCARARVSAILRARAAGGQ